MTKLTVPLSSVCNSLSSAIIGAMLRRSMSAVLQKAKDASCQKGAVAGVLDLERMLEGRSTKCLSWSGIWSAELTCRVDVCVTG